MHDAQLATSLWCVPNYTYRCVPGDIKLAQVRVLATKLAELAKKYDAAVIMAGDFNSTPDSAIYWFCSTGELALSRVDRRTMSGQLAEPLSPGGMVRGPFHMYIMQPHSRVCTPEKALLWYNDLLRDAAGWHASCHLQCSRCDVLQRPRAGSWSTSAPRWGHR